MPQDTQNPDDYRFLVLHLRAQRLTNLAIFPNRNIRRGHVYQVNVWPPYDRPHTDVAD